MEEGALFLPAPAPHLQEGLAPEPRGHLRAEHGALETGGTLEGTSVLGKPRGGLGWGCHLW